MKSMAFTNSADTAPAEMESMSMLTDAASLGTRVGFRLSVLYGLFWVAVSAILLVLSAVDDGPGAASSIALMVPSVLFTLFYGVVIALVVGGVPGALIGLVTAAIASFLLARVSQERRERAARSITLGVALAIVALLHIALFPILPRSPGDGGHWVFYALFLGVPSVIYVAASIKMAPRLHTGLGQWDVGSTGQDPQGKDSS